MGVFIESLDIAKRKIPAEYESIVTVRLYADQDEAVNVMVYLYGDVAVAGINPSDGSVVVSGLISTVSWSQVIKAGHTNYAVIIKALKRPYTSTGVVIAKSIAGSGESEKLNTFVTGSYHYEEPQVIPNYTLGKPIILARLWTPHRIEPGDTMELRCQPEITTSGNIYYVSALQVISGPIDGMELLSHNGMFAGKAGCSSFWLKDLQCTIKCNVPGIARVRGTYAHDLGEIQTVEIVRDVGIGVNVPVLGPPKQPPGPGPGPGPDSGICPWWFWAVMAAGGLGVAYEIAREGKPMGE